MQFALPGEAFLEQNPAVTGSVVLKSSFAERVGCIE